MNYLILLRRADFIDLYKYGFLYVNKDRIVQFDCTIREIESNSEIFDSLFEEVNSFENSFTYLILHYKKEVTPITPTIIYIEEVQHVFPLDMEAKKEFEHSFDEHIRIENPIWNDAVSLIQKRKMFDSSMQGIRNVFKIFNLDGLDFCRAIIDDNSIEEMLSDVYDNKHPSGERTIWTYLMQYERHSFYPKDTLGYFMDVVHVICNYMAKREVEDHEVENTTIYKILDSYNGSKLKYNEIYERLKQDNRASGFLKKVCEFVPDVDFICIAVNYLVLIARYSEEFTFEHQFVESCKSSFGQSFTIAAYMLGIALSHDKTYSCLYETLPLPIYKSQEEMQEIRLRKEYEKEKAKREMKRMEDERERERQMRRGTSRNNGKKKRKSYNPFDRFSYSHGRYHSDYGYDDRSFSSPQNSEQSTHRPSFREDDPNNIRETSPSDNGIKRQHVETPSLFSSEENLNLMSFPITMQKYTGKGHRSTAKGSIKVVHTVEEYEQLVNSREDWRIKK